MMEIIVILKARAAHKALALSILLVIMAMPYWAYAQTAVFTLPPPDEDSIIHISADEVVYFRKLDELYFKGSVVVKHPDYIIKADSARAFPEKQIISAEGNVKIMRVEDGKNHEVLAADNMEFDAASGTGWLVKARLVVPFQNELISFDGDRIEKIDDHTYLIKKGSFTWCRCEDGKTPDWEVAGDEINADTKGDAVIKGARVKIRGRGFMEFPYFRYPIGTDRKSGFLFPIIETSSSDGVQIEVPYYYVINKSMDATVYPRYIEKRGIDLGSEFRYNYGEVAKGEIKAFYIDDSKEHASRGGIRIIHRSDIDEKFSVAADISYITDNEVLFDFDHRKMGDERQRALESRLVTSYHWPYMNLTAELSAFDDLMGEDLRDSDFGKDRDEEMVQRLPAVNYTLLTRPILSPLMFDVTGYAAKLLQVGQRPGCRTNIFSGPTLRCASQNI